MREAIAEAKLGDYPFGAVIVRDGKVLAKGRNLGKLEHDPTAHAEMVAIRQFLRTHGAEKLKGTTLYTSGEPCCMCMGAIIWCGISRIVFAASVDQLAGKIGQIMIGSAEVANKTPLPSSISRAECWRVRRWHSSIDGMPLRHSVDMSAMSGLQGWNSHAVVVRANMRSILVAMMKSFSCSPWIFLVCRETVTLPQPKLMFG